MFIFYLFMSGAGLQSSINHQAHAACSCTQAQNTVAFTRGQAQAEVIDFF